MKPSEFWTRVLALPEQARQAEHMASDLRTAADVLCDWGRLAMVNFQRSKDAADAGDMAAAEDWLGRIPPHPNELPSGAVEAHQGDEQRPRKQRSDAGKTRSRKGPVSPEEHRKTPNVAIYDSDPDPPEDDGGPPANPADVKARDAARITVAGEIRTVANSEADPLTIKFLVATLSRSEQEIRDALKLLSLVSWRMQREGDSQPVEVWGTWRQLRDHIERGYADSANDEAIAQDLSIRVQDVRFALGASRV